MKIVMKFGGASVADSDSIKQVAGIIADYAKQKNQIIVVVSALKDVTNQLLEASEKAREGNKSYVERFVKDLMERHLTIVQKAINDKSIQRDVTLKISAMSDELEKALTGIAHLGDLSPRSKDYILSFGERFSVRLLCNILRDIGLNTECFTGKEVGIVTDSNFGEARPLLKLSKHQIKEKIEPLLEKRIIPLITGYIAATQDGIVTTLGRGGSDYTATIVGAAIEADEVWIWTDVDGLMTADPKIVSSAKVIPTISFAEAIEMAVFGAKAMHPRALEPAMEEEIPVRIRNAFNPKNTGTLIVSQKRIKPQGIVKAVTLIKDAALITVSGAGMVGTPGTAAKVFDILGRNSINILMISQSVSEANISFAIQRNQLDKAVSSLEIALLGKGVVQDVSAEDDVCIIAVVGAGMKGTRGVASRVFGAVANAGVNVRMIAQGGSELNISFIVKETDGKKAVQAIHEEFKLDKLGR